MADPVARWTPTIAEAAARFGLPAAWIEWVIRAESGGRTGWRGNPIRSKAGAIGIMQLMPATWSDMRNAYRLGSDPDDPHDNIIAGSAYLRMMADRFGYPGAFAAYNVGPARYADYLAGKARLPAETIAYLGAVTGHAALTPAPNVLFVQCQEPAGSAPATEYRPSRDAIFAIRRDVR